MDIFQIYLGGGMTNLSLQEQNEWRIEIKKKFEEYDSYYYKIKCINPVEYYNVYDSAAYDSDLEVMQFDLHKVKKSDLIIINFNDMKSLGTMAELAIAYDKNIPVIGLNESGQQLHPWQYCMTSKVFTNMDDMLDYIKRYYFN